MNEQLSDRQSALDDFAAAAATKQELLPPVSRAATPQLIHGAQAIIVPRDEARVLLKISTLATAAGEDWYYRIPFKDKKGSTTWVEGASIKLANDIARIYGSCDVDTWVSNEGIDFWEISARFIDLESGYALTRLFRQRKGAARVGGGDEARNQEISFQIGTSKAIRNVIVNALQTYADYGYEQARNALVTKIGKNVEGWRSRTHDEISKLGIAINRVEAVIGRAEYEWLAPDLAKVVAMIKAINDGMATVDETFPPLKTDAAKPDKALEEFASKPVDAAPEQHVKTERPEERSPGQAAASPTEESHSHAGGAAADDPREEAVFKLLNMASDDSLGTQERLENLENIIPTWEDQLEPAFLKALADNCTKVVTGEIRRSTAVKRLEELMREKQPGSV